MIRLKAESHVTSGCVFLISRPLYQTFSLTAREICGAYENRADGIRPYKSYPTSLLHCRGGNLPPDSLLLEGSEAARVAMNDSPVDCQNREWTEPQRDRWHGVAVTDEVFQKSLRHHLISRLSATASPQGEAFAPSHLSYPRQKFVKINRKAPKFLIKNAQFVVFAKK